MEKRKAQILIVGGGFGGLFTALELTNAGEVTLVNDDDHFVFAPLLYEYLSGEVEAWHIAPYYKDLLDDNIRFLRGTVDQIDFDRREAHLAGWHNVLRYDVLVLAAGGVTNYWNVPGAAEYALPFRKIRHADELRRRMTVALDRVAPDTAPQDAHEKVAFAVVGGGASGVELATKMADLLNDAFRRRGLRGEPQVVILEMSDNVVPGMGEEIRDYVEDALHGAHVKIHTKTRVVEVKPNSIISEHNGVAAEMQTAAVVWTAGVRVSPLVEKLALAKGERGLILVEQTMQAQGRPEIFALGDSAKVEDIPPALAGTAQLAFQEASLTAENIKNFWAGREIRAGRFEELGEALSLGTENAAVLVGDRAFGGKLARDARFALYTSRLPTWHHRLRVGASWFFEGTKPRPLQPLNINH